MLFHQTFVYKYSEKLLYNLNMFFDEEPRKFFDFTYKASLFQTPEWLNLGLHHVFNVFYIGYFLFLLLIFIFFLASKTAYFNTKLLSLAEKEVSSFDDAIIFLSVVLIVYFYNFFGCFNIFLFLSDNRVTTSFFLIVLFLVTLVPITMVFNFGFYTIIHIRGGGTTLSFFYELILDYINIISFFLRLLIQAIRLVIITTMYLGYNHLILTYNFNMNIVSYNEYSKNHTDNILTVIRYVIEVGHIFAIFFAQFCAFLLMLLWLFQFLFTLFSYTILEKSARIK